MLVKIYESKNIRIGKFEVKDKRKGRKETERSEFRTTIQKDIWRWQFPSCREKKTHKKYQIILAYIFIMYPSKINVTEIFQNKIFILTRAVRKYQWKSELKFHVFQIETILWTQWFSGLKCWEQEKWQVDVRKEQRQNDHIILQWN